MGGKWYLYNVNYKIIVTSCFNQFFFEYFVILFRSFRYTCLFYNENVVYFLSL